MERLTKAEEQVMQQLWKLGPSFVRELVEAMPKPRPAVTTVSTIVRILEEKGFVGHEAFGRSHRYHPLLTKEAYGKRSMSQVVRDYFGSSPSAVLSHFLEKDQLDAREVDELLKLLQDRKRSR